MTKIVNELRDTNWSDRDFDSKHVEIRNRAALYVEDLERAIVSAAKKAAGKKIQFADEEEAIKWFLIYEGFRTL